MRKVCILDQVQQTLQRVALRRIGRTENKPFALIHTIFNKNLKSKPYLFNKSKAYFLTISKLKIQDGLNRISLFNVIGKK
jgi:hypothetical protein